MAAGGTAPPLPLRSLCDVNRNIGDKGELMVVVVLTLHMYMKSRKGHQHPTIIPEIEIHSYNQHLVTHFAHHAAFQSLAIVTLPLLPRFFSTG